ncbi:hypothetical protein HanIR_Chr02g0066631 [Helianthus annuus]|nr:hypothetical protein HanIR_Chr02g0066631 [Helianthus annuus]
MISVRRFVKVTSMLSGKFSDDSDSHCKNLHFRCDFFKCLHAFNSGVNPVNNIRST